MLRIAIFILIGLSAFGQEMTGDEAIAKVYRVLSLQEKSIPQEAKRDTLLRGGPWEALAYIDASRTFQPTEEDLNEAVPDYYRFSAQGLLFKLIHPEDHNQYGYEGQLQYRWEGKTLVVLSKDGKTVKDRWELLYLDANYLALKMGDLRVFFTHTRPQE